MAIPVRQSSPRETAASFGVLLVLAAVVAWLWFAQARFSPAVTVAATAAQAAERGSTAHDSGPAGAARDPAPTLLAAMPTGLKPMSPAEAFSPATLSDKIDGKAELYLPAGFVGMRCQRLAPATNPAAWFEAFIYNMGKPENAFAVYSTQKRTATEDAGIGDHGYVAGNQLCLVHGQYYLEFVGADEGGATIQSAKLVAAAFIAATHVAPRANVARDEALFPSANQVPNSVMLLSSDVFGFDQLNNTWVARYKEGARTVTLFLSRRPAPGDASKLATSVRGFFVDDCGGRETATLATMPGAAIVDIDGDFSAVFASGSLVAGVHQAPSREAAERWLQLLASQVKTTSP